MVRELDLTKLVAENRALNRRPCCLIEDLKRLVYPFDDLGGSHCAVGVGRSRIDAPPGKSIAQAFEAPPRSNACRAYSRGAVNDRVARPADWPAPSGNN